MNSRIGLVLVSAVVAAVAVGGPLRSESSESRSVTLMEWDKAIVRIGRDCRAEPETVVLDRPGPWVPGKRFEALWIVDKRPGDTVTLRAKSATELGDGDLDRGRALGRLFDSTYVLPGDKNAITSGRPRLGVLASEEGDLVWRYDIEIRDADGGLVCLVDPQMIVRG